MGENTYLPDEESGAADIVREIFERYADGEKQREIAISLGERGVRTKRGNMPENRWVEYILRNACYISKLRYTVDGIRAVSKRDYDNENIMVVDGNWQPLISKELWDKVQKMLDKLREGRDRQAREAAEQFVVESKENDNFLTRSKTLMEEAVKNNKKKVLTEAEAEKIAGELEELVFMQLNIAAEIYVLPAEPMQSKWLNERKSRYDACKLIDAFKNDCIYTILLLHNDISIPKYRGKADWGVLGLTLQPGKTCVISDFRLKHKKRDMAKVILHEFIHAYYNYKHCPKDDATCIMKDAKGKADFSNKNGLCKECRAQIEKVEN